MIKRVLVLAALATGAVLLTACDRGGQESSTEQDTKSAKLSTEDTRNASAGDITPVDCGEIDVDGATHNLIAEPAATGLVGCTEAFNVIDEYLTIPVQRRGADLEGTQLANGWSCVTDDGETAAIYCARGNDEFTFRTEPTTGPGAAPTESTDPPASDLQPVTCGDVEVDGATHKLVAQPANDGIVGCTEAFNVIDEYLAIPAETRGASLDGTPLANNWSCVTDDGETAGVGCVQGQRVGDTYDFVFHTEPV